MIYLEKIRNYFYSPANKLARFFAIEEGLKELDVRKQELVESYSEIQKAVETGLPERMTFDDYVVELAKLKYEGERLSNIKKALECDKEVKAIRKCSANKLLKSLYRENKLTLDLYNEAANVSKAPEGQVRYTDVVVTCGDFFLLTKRAIDPTDKNSGAWVIPGGHVDPGESDLEAAERELREETGLSLLSLSQSGKVYSFMEIGHYTDDKADIVYYNLELENIFDVEFVLDVEEVRHYEWVRIADIDNFPMVFNMKDNIKEYMGWGDVIEKGKTANVGEVRVWQGVKMRKEATGWVPVTESDKGKPEEETQSEPKTPIDLTEHAKRASQVALQNAVKMAPESEVRAAAAKELKRREVEESGEENFTRPEQDAGQDEDFDNKKEPMEDIKKSRLDFVESRMASDITMGERTLLAENFYDEYMAVIKKSTDSLCSCHGQGLIDDELFEKSIKNLSHLVPKRVQVKGKDSKVHNAIRWVSPGQSEIPGEQAESETLTSPRFNYTKKGFDTNLLGRLAAIGHDSALSNKEAVEHFINNGIFEPSIMCAISGRSYEKLRLVMKSMEIDFRSLLGEDGNPISNDEEVRGAIAEEQANRDPDSIPEEIEVRDLEDLWGQYSRNLRRVMKGAHKFCLAFGLGGLGKTFEFWQELKKIKPEMREWNEEIQPNKDQYDFVIVSGKITPTQVYAELYRHRDKLVVFDDCDSFLKEDEVQGFLKAGLDTGERCMISNKSGARIYEIQGDNTSPAIPNTFNFTGRVIAITNLKVGQIDQAVRSRAMTSDLTMTLDETVEKLGKIKDKILIFNANKSAVIEVSQKARDLAYEAVSKYRKLLGVDLNSRSYQTAIIIADEAIEEGLPDEKVMKRLKSNFDSLKGTFSTKISEEEKANKASEKEAYKENYRQNFKR